MLIFEPEAFWSSLVFEGKGALVLHAIQGGLDLQGAFLAKMSTWQWSALTETDCGTHVSRIKMAGLEAMTGHHFLADDMPFEMALVQYSFHGLSPGTKPKRSCPIALRLGGDVFRSSWYGQP